MPDAVVIGSGPNGLVAANLLVDHGWSVVVLEAVDEPGGAVKSKELVEPGFVNDEFSAFYPLAAASKVIGGLHLEDHGLRWRRAPLVLAHPSSDGSCPYLSTDIEETAGALEACAPGDGEAWRTLYQRYERVREGLLGALLTPFPAIPALARLVGALRPSELLRFARFGVLSMRRLGEESFSGEASTRLLAGNGLHADFSPDHSLGGFFAWLLTSLGQDVGYPVPEGGAGNLARAMVRRLESRGAEIRCSTPVTRVVIRDGRAVAVVTADGTEIGASRAVVADVPAPALFLDLVGAEHLSPALVADVRRFDWDWATVKVDWTLDAPIPWEAEPARRAGTVHVIDSLDRMTIATAQLAAKRVPDRPFLIVGQQSMTDPTRQPAGKETAWAYTHVPRHIVEDAGGQGIGDAWSERDTELMADRMEAEIERLAPGFRGLVRGRHVFTPVSLEQANPSLVRGAINGGTAQLHQQLVFRPVPGLARAETPIRGLYLGSSSAHPGGGVHGACGSNAARAAILGDRTASIVARLRPLR
ncbi:MAG TPA: NAD(P)/FAD-dependent oxidoreductase [Acidimicrobiales bacterium]|nr:NAD(P)/FAD-dependent oxidoreductase [Acidimicrobiales bacterium]